MDEYDYSGYEDYSDYYADPSFVDQFMDLGVPDVGVAPDAYEQVLGNLELGGTDFDVPPDLYRDIAENTVGGMTPDQWQEYYKTAGQGEQFEAPAGGYKQPNADEIARERARYEAYTAGNAPVPDYAAQEMQISDNAMKDFQGNLQNIMDQGGYTSQWQTSGSDRIMVNDDGTAIGINTETGETYSLSQDQVNSMIKSGALNSGKSGYVPATGGKGNIPGGGTRVGNNIVMPDGKKIPISSLPSSKTNPLQNLLNKITGKGNQKDMMSLLPLLLAMMAANKQQAPATTIPSLGASRSQLPYSPPRPGEKNVSYFTPVTYRAAGGIAGLNESNLGGYSDGGRLLKGPGDGVSDDIPATIGGKQPARLADGEFVVPARIVSELGNGSTDAGARKLYDMMKRVEQTRKKGKHIAQDTKADKHLPA